MMILYIFGAEHQNYACFISWQIQEMKIIPEAAKKDSFVMHVEFQHSDGGGTAVLED